MGLILAEHYKQLKSENIMRTKNDYLKALLKYNASWIRLSFLNPNKFMINTDLILHAVAYRRLTGINLYTLKGA